MLSMFEVSHFSDATARPNPFDPLWVAGPTCSAGLPGNGRRALPMAMMSDSETHSPWLTSGRIGDKKHGPRLWVGRTVQAAAV